MLLAARLPFNLSCSPYSLAQQLTPLLAWFAILVASMVNTQTAQMKVLEKEEPMLMENKCADFCLEVALRL